MVEARKKLLQHLLTGVSNLDDLKENLKAIFERVQVAMRGELIASQYVFQTDLVKARIRKLLTALDNKAMEWVNAKVSASFSLPPPGYKPSTNLTVELPILGSRLNRNFLGKYEALFKNPIEQPVPTWEAFDWLIEDNGYLCKEKKCYDLLYAEELKDSYQEEAPEAVKKNGHFCDCPRRYRWNPEALIDSKE